MKFIRDLSKTKRTVVRPALRRALLSFALIMLGNAPFSTRAAWAETALADPPLHVLLSITWEGAHLKRHDLAALETIRSKYPFPVLHLMSPAYFSKPGAQKEQVAATLRAALKPGDELGIYVAPWRSLIQAAGIAFRSRPTFWGGLLSEGECVEDCGGEVPLTAYSQEDIGKLIATSVRFFTDNSFERPKTFSAGGWVASPEVLEAARSQGFLYDVSAVPPMLVKRHLGLYPIFHWLKPRWQGISEFSMPHIVKTKGGTIVEIPLTTASVDYLSSEELFRLLQRMSERRRTSKTPVFFHVHLHQETAWKYLSRVTAILDRLTPSQGQPMRPPLKPVLLPLGSESSLLDNL